jgi:hypothetical protein
MHCFDGLCWGPVQVHHGINYGLLDHTQEQLRSLLQLKRAEHGCLCSKYELQDSGKWASQNAVCCYHQCTLFDSCTCFLKLQLPSRAYSQALARCRAVWRLAVHVAKSTCWDVITHNTPNTYSSEVLPLVHTDTEATFHTHILFLPLFDAPENKIHTPAHDHGYSWACDPRRGPRNHLIRPQTHESCESRKTSCSDEHWPSTRLHIY